LHGGWKRLPGGRAGEDSCPHRRPVPEPRRHRAEISPGVHLACTRASRTRKLAATHRDRL